MPCNCGKKNCNGECEKKCNCECSCPKRCKGKKRCGGACPPCPKTRPCELPILFHTIVIPESMGDDVTGLKPPKNGAYRNVVVEYEAGGAVYLYNSDGVYSKLGASGGGGGEGTVKSVNLVNPDLAGNVSLKTSDIPNDSDYQTGSDVATAIAGKQDKLDTTQMNAVNSGIDSTAVAKLAGIAAGAEVNVQSDWSEADSSSDAYIKNKPTIPAAQVQSDWSEEDSSAVDYIKNKPQNLVQDASYVHTDNNFTNSDATKLSGLANIKSVGTNLNLDANGELTATDTTYSAGTGLDLTGTTFSVDTTTIQPKLTAGTNVSIDANNEISATDTTYSDFTGTDGTNPGTSGLVPAPGVADSGKFLGAGGLWETVAAGGVIELTAADVDYPDSNPTGIALWRLDPGVYYLSDTSTLVYASTSSTGLSAGTYIVADYGSASKQINVFAPSDSVVGYFRVLKGTGAQQQYAPYISTVVQATGTSQTSVMSQNATSRMVFADPATRGQIQIGLNASTSSFGTGVAIGSGATTRSWFGTSIGTGAKSRHSGVSIGVSAGDSGTADHSVLVGEDTATSATYSVAVGSQSMASSQGEVSFGGSSLGTNGYNSSQYRLLTNVYDPQNAHDAANKEYCDNATINGGTTAPTTTTAGAVGTQYTYVDTTGTPTAHLCVCTEIDTTDPNNPVYTWQTLV